VAATKLWRVLVARLGGAHSGRVTRTGVTTAQAASLLGGMLAAGAAQAVDLPEERAEAMVHVYEGGGVSANGPALLVRKSLADRVSLSAQYYVDMVSNASIDVVTTASPFRERRDAYDFGASYAYRDSLITVGVATSREPDYQVNSGSLDVSQEVFGGMTTVSMGFTRSSDKVGKKDIGFFDTARHWQYRFGVTQVLTPRWLASGNFEAISDEGFLGSPYRSALVFGAAVPERNPRTRSSRAVKLGAIGDITGVGGIEPRTSVRAEYRYFWDNWAIKAHTAEIGASRYFGDPWLADAFLRLYKQNHALFYSDNATSETTYVSRNRQLSTFNSVGLGARLTHSAGRYQGKYDIKVNGSYEFVRFRYGDFTDIRTGQPYAFDANVLQMVVSATF
jgi:hypothetical protein